MDPRALFEREYKDVRQPLIFIHPGYKSLSYDEKVGADRDYANMCALDKNRAYPQIMTDFVLERCAQTSRFLAMECRSEELTDETESRFLLLYDLDVSREEKKFDPREIMFHPFLVVKEVKDFAIASFDVEGKPVETIFVATQLSPDADGEIFAITQVEVDEEDEEDEPDEPDIITDNVLLQKHFRIGCNRMQIVKEDDLDAGFTDDDDGSLLFGEDVVFSGLTEITTSDGEFNPAIDEGAGTVTVGDLVLSLSLNVTSIKSVSRLDTAGLVTIGRKNDAANMDALYAAILQSPSRQGARLCSNKITPEKDSTDPENIFDACNQLEQLMLGKNSSLFPLRHICTVWLTLFKFYYALKEPKIDTPTKRVKWANDMLVAIQQDTCWQTCTVYDFEFHSSQTPRLLQFFTRFIFSLDENNFSENNEADRRVNEILSKASKIMGVNINVRPKLDLFYDTTNPFFKSFRRDCDDTAKIFKAASVSSNVELTTQKADLIPACTGGYAIELNRIAGAIATGEVECVPDYVEGQTDYRCLKGNVSLDALPKADNRHPHPVATYFSQAAVVGIVKLLRDGYDVKSVTRMTGYTFKDQMKWPIRPAIEIQSDISPCVYIKPTDVDIDYPQPTVRSPRKQGDRATFRHFVGRLQRRAQILPYLPAIAVFEKTDEVWKAVLSHPADINPLVVILISGEKYLAVVNTESGEGIFTPDPATTKVLNLGSSFNGLIPSKGLFPELWKFNIAGSLDSDKAKWAAVLDVMCTGANNPAKLWKNIQYDPTNAMGYFNDDFELFGIPSLRRRVA